MGWRLGHRGDDQAPAGARAGQAQAAQSAGHGPEPAKADAGLAELLRADRGVVAFTGRAAELARLRAWCSSDPVRSVQVLAGAGGSGKTRLALEIAAWCEADGGRWRLVAAGDEGQAVAAARADHPDWLLLVVEHAEARAGLAELLRTVAEDPGPVRLLLVTRALGEWWDRLIESSAPQVARLLAETEPVRLDAPVRPDVSDQQLAEAAVPDFARVLSVAAPGRVEVDRAAVRMPVLMLHAAALVGLLRFSAQRGPALRVVPGDRVLDALLEHEALYWRRTAVAAGLPGTGTLPEQVVAAAALADAGTVEEAAAAVQRVPDLAQRSPEQRWRWVRWLYTLYPAGADGRLGLLQPDLVAETHVAAQLAADPVLARSCLGDLTPEQAEHALTVLARASAHQDRARQVLATALRDHLAQLGIPAGRVAQRTAGDLGQLLARAITDAAVPPEVLADLALALPYPSAALADAHLVATLRALESPTPGSGPQARALADDRAGLLLARLDLHAGTRPAQEAATIRRELAARNPGRYRPGLAVSLIRLAALFAEADRPGDALRAEQEAVIVYRALASDDPGGYRADLARCLTGLAVRYEGVGRPADALGAEQEAVAVYRELTAADPGQYRPDLAASLTNLGVWFSESERPADALAPAREAVTIYRELAASPGQYRPDLAAALTNLGIWLSELGRAADAVGAEQEAVAIRRELAAADPDGYRPDLARSLGNLGIWFSELGRPADALRTEQEAVAIRRELAAGSPDQYRPDLAAALANLGLTYSQLGCPADALPVIKEAVTAYRELGQADPGRYRPDLARSLTSLGMRYAELGRPAAAVPPIQEAVTIRRKLAAARPDLYVPDLARSLTSLGMRLNEVGRAANAVPLEQEAVATYRELAAEHPERFEPGLGQALSSLAAALSALGRHPEAAQAAAEAAGLNQEAQQSARPAGSP